MTVERNNKPRSTIAALVDFSGKTCPSAVMDVPSLYSTGVPERLCQQSHLCSSQAAVNTQASSRSSMPDQPRRHLHQISW